MKKKLFVWAYIHMGVQTCALDSDGRMLFQIQNNNHTETVDLLFKDNKGLQDKYEIIVVDQKKLEDHVYHGAPREILREDFRLAWDKLMLGKDALG